MTIHPMRHTFVIFLLLLAGSPALLASLPSEGPSRAATAGQEIGKGPLSIAWTGLPEGGDRKIMLVHPEANLHNYGIQDVGNGVRQLCGNRNAVSMRGRRIQMRTLLDLDADRFQLKDQKGFWLAKRVVTPMVSKESGDPLELDFQWQPCGLLEFQGRAAPARSWGGPDAEPLLTFPTVSAEIRRVGESKSRPVRSTERPLKWLEPGAYEVVLTCPGRVTLTRTVRIEPGKVTGLDFEMPLLPGTRNVNLEVLAGPGPLPWMVPEGYETWAIFVFAHLSEYPSLSWGAVHLYDSGCGVGHDDGLALAWEKRGAENVAVATLYDVPPGELQYLIFSRPDAFHRSEQQMPNGDLSVVITILRDLEGPGWGFHEEGRGGPAKHPSLYGEGMIYALTDDHQSVELYEFEGESPRVPNRLAQPPARWAYCTSGHLPVFGAASDFRSNGVGWQLAKVEHRDGYRSEFLVVDAAGRPISGASILADGVEVVRTNSKGIGVVELASGPKLIEIESGDLDWVTSLNSCAPRVPWFRVQLGTPTKEVGETTPKDS